MECSLCNARMDDRQFIYQKGKAFCMVNYAPLKKGHLMVLPVRHETELKNLKGDELKDIHGILDELSIILKKVYGQDVIIEINRGEHGTQSHLHYHILPAKSGLREYFACYENVPVKKRATWEELAEMIEKVKKEI